MQRRKGKFLGRKENNQIALAIARKLIATKSTLLDFFAGILMLDKILESKALLFIVEEFTHWQIF